MSPAMDDNKGDALVMSGYRFSFFFSTKSPSNISGPGTYQSIVGIFSDPRSQIFIWCVRLTNTSVGTAAESESWPVPCVISPAEVTTREPLNSRSSASTLDYG